MPKLTSIGVGSTTSETWNPPEAIEAGRRGGSVLEFERLSNGSNLPEEYGSVNVSIYSNDGAPVTLLDLTLDEAGSITEHEIVDGGDGWVRGQEYTIIAGNQPWPRFKVTSVEYTN